ncbi:MAG: alpha/beta fold hydrolase [Gemmatimonadaceae bacterium]
MTTPDVSEVQIAGLRTLQTLAGSELTVVLLHGYAMRPEDLAPFARSLGVPARFVAPEGPLPAVPSGRAWWPIDQERRTEALAHGPRDLFNEHPTGTRAAREVMLRFFADLRDRWGDGPFVLVGFSQGGMLASDLILRTELHVAGLALLSSSRLSADEWAAHTAKVRGLPVLVSHGVADADLAFQAGERLRDFYRDAGASVTWVPHEQGHEVPLVVWRQLKKFLVGLIER